MSGCLCSHNFVFAYGWEKRKPSNLHSARCSPWGLGEGGKLRVLHGFQIPRPQNNRQNLPLMTAQVNGAPSLGWQAPSDFARCCSPGTAILVAGGAQLWRAGKGRPLHKHIRHMAHHRAPVPDQVKHHVRGRTCWGWALPCAAACPTSCLRTDPHLACRWIGCNSHGLARLYRTSLHAKLMSLTDVAPVTPTVPVVNS